MPDITQTACIILARGGSKGVSGKNLRHVGGVSLIGRSVRAARRALSVDIVYVSTDAADIAAEAACHGAVIVERPVELSGDMATSEAGWLHAAARARLDLPNLGKLVFLQCTSPFTTGQDIENCLKAMQDQGADCALSVYKDHSFLWGYDDAGFAVGINHTETEQRKRRQDLPPSFCESGAIYTVNLTAFEHTGQRFCGKIALCPVDHPPIEIDTLQDFALCSLIAQTRDASQVDPERLKSIRAVVMDFDGVHTDNLVTTDQNGVEMVTTSRGDGMGLSMLREDGRWRLMILSKERNPVVIKRAEKLKIQVFNAVDDKVAALDGWLQECGLNWEQSLYVGNDVNDRAAMERAGVSVCPSDSHPEILSIADWILPLPGGKGALRSMADTLLAKPV